MENKQRSWVGEKKNPNIFSIKRESRDSGKEKGFQNASRVKSLLKDAFATKEGVNARAMGNGSLT